MSDTTIEVTPQTTNPLPPIAQKQFNDISTDNVTELTKQYLTTVAEKIRLLESKMNLNSWLKYILLGTQFTSQVGNIGAGIVSTMTTQSIYPVAGVFAFSVISSLGLFIQTKLNPEGQIKTLQDLRKKLEYIQIELQTTQITKSVDRFKEVEANLDSILPILNF